MKIWKKLAIIIVVLLLLIDVGVANYLVNYAIGRSGDAGNREVALQVEEASGELEKKIADNKKIQQGLTEDFLGRVEENFIEISSDDGLKLKAGYFANADSHRWALVIHGYRGSHKSMLAPSQRFFDAGFNVVAPDLRACGDSQGDFVGMGWPDRLDMLKWIDWIIAKDSEASIVVYGISMGAATTMMTSGEETPDAVKVFVEDCGYTSVWDIFASELKLRFSLPEFPLMNTADIIAGIRAGWRFSEAESIEQLSKSTKPMLFIHGNQDDFVPFWMLQKNFDAKLQGDKELVEVDGAGHDEARFVLGDEYWNKVFNFIEKYL